MFISHEVLCSIFILEGFLCAKEKNIRMIYQSWLVQHSGKESNLVYPRQKKKAKPCGRILRPRFTQGLASHFLLVGFTSTWVEEMKKNNFKVQCKQTLRKYYTKKKSKWQINVSTWQRENKNNPSTRATNLVYMYLYQSCQQEVKQQKKESWVRENFKNNCGL